MIRPQLHEVLGHVVHARISLDGLKHSVIEEMQAGYRPTYRGHYWSHGHYEAITVLGLGLETAFDSAKWLQFPEGDFRKRDILERLAKEIPWKSLPSSS